MCRRSFAPLSDRYLSAQWTRTEKPHRNAGAHQRTTVAISMGLGQFIVWGTAKETLFASRSYGIHCLTWNSVDLSKRQTMLSVQKRIWKDRQALINHGLTSKMSITAVPSATVAQISTCKQDSPQPHIGDREEIRHGVRLYTCFSLFHTVTFTAHTTY